MPELLQYYRQVEDGLARTLRPEPAKRRLLDAYEDSLKAIGLQGGALALAGLYQSGQDMELQVRQLSVKTAHPTARYAVFSLGSNRFEGGLGAIERLRNLYRKLVPLEARLKLHEIFLAPLIGPYRPPSP
jgi:hypothetical protein